MYDWLLYGGLGVLAKCLWDFLWDALDRRHDRQYTQRLARIRELTPELDAPRPIGSPMDEIPASSPADPQPLGLIHRYGFGSGGRGAAQILGCRDLGGRWHPPTHHPEAQTSSEALAAWDGRTDRTVA